MTHMMTYMMTPMTNKYCTDTDPILNKCCTHAVPILENPENAVLVLYPYCTGTVPILYSSYMGYSNGTGWVQHVYSTGTIWVQHTRVVDHIGCVDAYRVC